MSIERLSEIGSYPAVTYALNPVESLVTRFGVPGLTRDERRTLEQGLGTAVEAIAGSDAPAVPLTEPKACELSARFADKIVWQLEVGAASDVIPGSLRNYTLEMLNRHCSNSLSLASGTSEMLVDPHEISQAYGYENLFNNLEPITQETLSEWGHQEAHPDIPTQLQRKVDLDTTKRLARASWQLLFGQLDIPPVDFRMTPQDKDYLLFWSSRDTSLNCKFIYIATYHFIAK
jgi:hypothetical protein